MQQQFKKITKHADAKNVWITIESKESKIHLQVRDDGVEFNKKERAKVLFLSILLIDWNCIIAQCKSTTAPRNGCYISISILVNNIKVPSFNSIVNV